MTLAITPVIKKVESPTYRRLLCEYSGIRPPFSGLVSFIFREYNTGNNSNHRLQVDLVNLDELYREEKRENTGWDGYYRLNGDLAMYSKGPGIEAVRILADRGWAIVESTEECHSLVSTTKRGRAIHAALKNEGYEFGFDYPELTKQNLF